MPTTSRRFLLAAACAAALASPLAFGQTVSSSAVLGAESALPLVDAEVRKIDARNGTITLKHAEIPNLEMPPMSMVFQVKEGVLPAAIAVGDKVRFRADKLPGGYTVMELVRLP